MIPLEEDASRPGFEVPERCRLVGEVLSRIGDKWSVMVILSLADGGRRFGELRRSVASISQRMLTLTLRNLERDGLVTRTVTSSIPPRVDYRLTELGRSLRGPVEAIGGWAARHGEDVRASREAYDARAGSASDDPGTARPSPG